MIVYVLLEPATGAASVLQLTPANWMGQLSELVDPQFRVQAVNELRADILGVGVFGSWYVQAHVFRLDVGRNSKVVFRWTAQEPQPVVYADEKSDDKPEADESKSEEPEPAAAPVSAAPVPAPVFAAMAPAAVLKKPQDENDLLWKAERATLTTRVPGYVYGFSDVFEAHLLAVSRVILPAAASAPAPVAPVEEPTLLAEVTARLKQEGFGLKPAKKAELAVAC